MKKQFKHELNTYCELHWWSFGKKKMQFKGVLKDLLNEQKVTFKISKTETEFIYNYTFTNPFGITFKVRGGQSDFTLYAKQFLQMEMCRMGDKASLYIQGAWRPKVTVNF